MAAGEIFARLLFGAAAQAGFWRLDLVLAWQIAAAFAAAHDDGPAHGAATVEATADGAGGQGAGLAHVGVPFNTWRMPLPSMAETMPFFSMVSSRRAAALYPMRSLRWT